jgi:hypothetical protein
MKGFAILTKKGKIAKEDGGSFVIFDKQKTAKANVIAVDEETFVEVEITIKKKE